MMAFIQYPMIMFCLVSLFALGFQVEAKAEPLPPLKNPPPRIFEYAPRKPSFSLPEYYFPCAKIQFYFPTSPAFSSTNDAKRNLNKEFEFIELNGDSVPNRLPDAYNGLVNAIVSDLSGAPNSIEGIRNVFYFEKALSSIAQCGGAIGQWETASHKLNGAFADYYSNSQFKEKFQSISQSKFSRNSLFQAEAFLSEYKRSNFIPPDLSGALLSDFNTANARLEMAREQYMGTYFAEGAIDNSKCIIEDADIKLRSGINTERLYPRAALNKGVEGEINISLNVDSSGLVTNAEFTAISDETFRDETILTSFRNSRFWPQIKDCKTAPGTGNQKIVFRIGD